MEWVIMPKSTALSQKSVRFLVHHPDGIASLRFAKTESLIHNKKITEGNTFQIKSNGTYFLEAVTKLGEILNRQFSVSFLDTQPKFAEGEGTAEHPYLIGNAQQLNAMRAVPNAYFQLLSDVDLSSSDWGIGWCPIGQCLAIQEKPGYWEGVLDHAASFSGDFDGGNHRISSVYCYAPEDVHVGFWGYMEGSVRNIVLDNCIFCGKSCVGGLAGTIGGNVNCCTIHGKVAGKTIIGGIAGAIMGNKNEHIDPMLPYNQVEACSFSGSIRGDSSVGGIIGKCETSNSIIRNCFVDANVFSVSSAAGISCSHPQRIENCFATGRIHMARAANDCFVAGIGIAYKFELPFCESEITCTVRGCVSAWREISFQGDGSICNPNLFGRISYISYDISTSPYEKTNLALNTMQIINGTAYNPIAEGSLQDGVSVSEQDLLKRVTYICLGWDMVHIWEISEGSFPRLKFLHEKTE